MQQVSSLEGDTIDLICMRIYGRTAGITEQLLAINPCLADLPAVLPFGTRLNLPNLPAFDLQTITNLWS